MLDKMIIDADLCIKLGGSDKYRYLYDILPLVAKTIYMHTHAYGEVMMPSSAVSQLHDLISDGKVELVNESGLDSLERVVFDAAYRNLEKVMIDPNRPNKNLNLYAPIFNLEEFGPNNMFSAIKEEMLCSCITMFFCLWDEENFFPKEDKKSYLKEDIV